VAGRASATATPGCPPATPWCWSTTAAPPACSCWTWPGASPPRCGNASGWRWNRSHAWSARTGEADVLRAPPPSATAACRAADAWQHRAVRTDGGGDPAGLGQPAHLRGGVLPQLLRPAGGAAAAAAPRPRAAAHAALPALPVPLPGRHLLDAGRLLGDRPPAAGAGDLAVLLHPAVRHHRRGGVAGRARARAALGRGGAGLHRRAADRAPRHHRLQDRKSVV